MRSPKFSRWSWSLVGAALFVAACSEPTVAPPSTAPRAVPLAPTGQRPRLFAGGGDRVVAATPVDAARAYVARLAPSWGAPAGTATLQHLASAPLALGQVVRFAQSFDGVPVDRREVRVLVRPDGSLGMASGVLLPADLARTGSFALTADDAVARAIAVTHGVGPAPSSLRALPRAAGDGAAWFDSRPGSAPFVEEARARRVWHDAGDHLEAAWVIEAYSAPTADTTDSLLYRTVVRADDGEVLEQQNLTADAFGYRVWAETTGDLRPLDGPTADFTPHPTGMPGAARPPYIASRLVTVDGLNHPAGGGAADPWLPTGATQSTGNHVDAYTDVNAPTGFSAGDFRASTTGPGAFDRVYDPTQSPLVNNQQMMAAITQLFYSMNWLHDDWYDAGFTEAARNGQDDNFGRGGIAGDRLRAEAQDGANDGNRNNANMSTPSDGMSPRMQVYLWSGAQHVTVTSQPGGALTASGAAFGPGNYDLTGTLVAGADGTAPAADGCQALTGNVTGRLVLVDRGNCTFKRKVLNAQQAGAAGVVIANNTGTGLPSLGNDSTITDAITIPSIGVTMAAGTALRTSLGAGAVSVTLRRTVDPDNDGALDGALVAHEYGHYLHHRLSDCNTVQCGAMSEGWADWFALHMMARPGDDLDGTFAMSTYAESDDPYFGIRRVPYSVDFDRNALTLGHMANGAALPTRHPIRQFGANAEVHNAGEIWASMMWEAYVALQRSRTSFDEARDTMARYVVAGLMMAPTDATVTEVRDAILQAAFMANPPDHDLLAAAFARRGAGSCAQPPARASVDFTEAVDSFTLSPNSYATAPALTIDVEDCDGDGVLDVGETATVRTTVGNNGAADLGQVTIALTSTTPGVEIQTAPIVVPSLARYTSMPLEFKVALTAGQAPIAGELKLTVDAAGACTPNLAISAPLRMNVDEAPASAATDTFDATSTWARTGPGARDIWQQERESALDGQWHGEGFGGPSETAIESPPMTAGSGPVTIRFHHAFDFEFTDDTVWDGGVIEVSSDGGTTWTDVGAMATPGYVGVITDQSGNSLAGRMAYGGRNPSFPAKDEVTLALGTALAGKTFQLRFLIGTDQAVGATGWLIDDLEVTGITNKPFPAQIDDAGACNPDKGEGDGGCCQTGSSAGGSLTAAGLLVGLALVRRRRRAAR